MPTQPDAPPPPVARAPSAAFEPIPLVKAAFEAFSNRDLAAAEHVCHPDMALRTFATSSRARRDGAYRGYAGLRRYFDDVAAVWTDLRLIPSNWWETEHGVVVAGRAHASAEGVTHTNEALWIFRFSDELISSIDVFPQPG
jgi:ketosteroid isomerase-like protein